MSIFRAQIGFQIDSTLPRDTVTINPHYNGSDAQALANVLKTSLIANVNIGNGTPFVIKVYDAKKAPPSFPLATASNGTGMVATSLPREVALCLSYYAGFNRPSYRGRLFIPFGLVGGTLGLRPTGAQMTSVANWATTLFKSLPANTFGTVFSKKLGTDAQITNWWVDDEWDTVRSRGLRPTTRQVGTLP
jgi:hypothetical protein